MALVRERDHTVSEVAKFLRRDQANVSMMLLRAFGTGAESIVESVMPDPMVHQASLLLPLAC